MDTVKRRTRWGLWLLIIVLAVLSIAYSVLWFVTKPMIEDFADNWVEERRNFGLNIEYSERRVEGFPFNFKLVFDDPVISEPDVLIREWRAEQIQLHSRPWNFYPMLANWWGKVEGYAPGKSTLRDQYETTHTFELSPASRLLVAWNSEGMTSVNLKLEEFAGVINREDLETENFVFAATPSETLEGAFDLNLSWDSIVVPTQWLSSARLNLSEAPPAAAAIATGILDGLEKGEAADIPMPNALALGDRPMLFGIPLN